MMDAARFSAGVGASIVHTPFVSPYRFNKSTASFQLPSGRCPPPPRRVDKLTQGDQCASKSFMNGLDDISLVTSTVSLVQQAYSFGKFLKEISGTDVISAHFDWDGQRISGDDKIEIERHFIGAKEAIWFFSVKEIPGYTFVRAPVIQSATVELIGTKIDDKNPDARFWRWIAPRLPGVIYGGQDEPPNLKVEFIVVGYRTDALIKHLAATG